MLLRWAPGQGVPTFFYAATECVGWLSEVTHTLSKLVLGRGKRLASAVTFAMLEVRKEPVPTRVDSVRVG